MITFSSPAASAVLGSSTASVAFDVANVPTSVTCKLDSGTASACTSPAVYSGLADGSHTVTVVAKNAAGTATLARAFKVDTTAPTVSISSPVANSSVKSPAKLTFTSADATTIVARSCQVDGGTAAACVSGATFALAGGSHTIAVSATDQGGNVGTASVTFGVATIPTLVVSAPASAAILGASTASVEFATTNDPTSVTCKLDSGVATACTSPATYSGLADGSHTVTVVASNVAGTVTVARAFKVDTTAPTVTITAPVANSSVKSPAKVTFAATDASTIVARTCQVDGGAPAACVSGASFTLAGGGHTISVTATDQVGNVGSASIAFNVALPPTLTVTAPAASAVLRSASASVEFATTNAPSTVTCKLDTGVATSCASPFTYTGLADGSHTATVTASNVAGTVGVARAFKVDTTPPAVSFTAPANGAVLKSPAKPTFTISDATTIVATTCQVDAGSPAPCVSGASFALTGGNHTITVAATDQGGNVGSSSVSFIVATIPTLTINSPTSGGVLGSSTANVAFDIANTPTSVTCKLDTGTATTCASPITYTALSDGSHTVTVVAANVAGSVTVARAFKVDTLPPSVVISAPASGSVAKSPVKLTFTTTDATTITARQCEVDGGAPQDCVSGSTYSLAGGQHNIRVSATDQGGNVGTSVVSFTATSVPRVSIASPADGGYVASGSLVANFTATESPTSVKCKIDAGVAATCQSPRSLASLGDGVHSLTVSATNAYGTGSATTTFTVDTSPPQLQLDSPANGESFDHGTYELSYQATDLNLATLSCSVDGAASISCPPSGTTIDIADGQHQVLITALDLAGNSTSAVSQFIVSSGKTTISAGPEDGETVTSAISTFEFTSTYGESFECAIDSGGWEPCDSPYETPAFSNGSHTFQVRAINSSGTHEAAPAQRTFSVARSAPTLSLVGVPQGTIADATPRISFDGSGDHLTFECQADLDGWNPCASPWDVPELADGPHSISVRAIDSVGDTSTASAAFTVAASSLTTEITEHPESPTAESSARFAFSSNLSSGTFECRFDDDEFQTCASPIDSTSVTEPFDSGDHEFQVRAVDIPHGLSASTATYDFSVDRDAPTATVDPADSDVSGSDRPTFLIAADDDDATFTCWIDDAEPAACTTPYETPALQDGEHTVHVQASDAVGNQQPSPTDFEFDVDTSHPDTEVTSNYAEGATGRQPPAFQMTGEDLTYECAIDDSEWGDCGSDWEPDVLDGTHTAHIRAINLAGNIDDTPYERTFTLDTTPPEISIDSGPDDQSYVSERNVEIAFSSEPGASFDCKVDAGDFSSCTSPFDASDLDDGAHTVSIQATDQAGNTSAAPESRSFNVDTSPPDTSIEEVVTAREHALGAVPTSPLDSNHLVADVKASEPRVSIQCRIDAESFSPCNGQEFVTGTALHKITLGDGQHTVEARAVDAAGNADPSPASATFSVASTEGAASDESTEIVPVSPTFSDSDTIQTATPEFRLVPSQAGVDGFECSVDGGPFVSCPEKEQLVPLSNGQHSFSARSVAGGVAETNPPTINFSVDVESPAPDTALDDVSFSSSSSVVTAHFHSPDSPVTFVCRIDEEAWVPCESASTIRPSASLEDGSHNFDVSAFAGGRLDGSPASATFLIDTEAPTPDFSQTPTNEELESGTGTFSFASSVPGVAFECALDDAAPTTCDSPVALTDLSEGEHSFSVVARDQSGNASQPIARTFTVPAADPGGTSDQDPPDTSIDSVPWTSEHVTQARGRFEFSSTEPGHFECRYDARAFTPCSGDSSQYDLADGDHSFAVRAVDQSGNRDATPATANFVVDAQAPPPPVMLSHPRSQEPLNNFRQGTLYINEFSFAPVADGHVRCSINGLETEDEASGVCVASLGALHNSGVNVLRAWSVDDAGNTSNSISYSWTLPGSAQLDFWSGHLSVVETTEGRSYLTWDPNLFNRYNPVTRQQDPVDPSSIDHLSARPVQSGGIVESYRWEDYPVAAGRTREVSTAVTSTISLATHAITDTSVYDTSSEWELRAVDAHGNHSAAMTVQFSDLARHIDVPDVKILGGTLLNHDGDVVDSDTPLTLKVSASDAGAGVKRVFLTCGAASIGCAIPSTESWTPLRLVDIENRSNARSIVAASDAPCTSANDPEDASRKLCPHNWSTTLSLDPSVLTEAGGSDFEVWVEDASGGTRPLIWDKDRLYKSVSPNSYYARQVPARISVDKTPPADPYIYSLTDENGTISAKWSSDGDPSSTDGAPGSGVDHFDVRHRINQGDWIDDESVDGSDDWSETLPGGTAGDHIEVAVTAVDRNGLRSSTASENTTTTNDPDSGDDEGSDSGASAVLFSEFENHKIGTYAQWISPTSQTERSIQVQTSLYDAANTGDESSPHTTPQVHTCYEKSECSMKGDFAYEDGDKVAYTKAIVTSASGSIQSYSAWSYGVSFNEAQEEADAANADDGDANIVPEATLPDSGGSTATSSIRKACPTSFLNWSSGKGYPSYTHQPRCRFGRRTSGAYATKKATLETANNSGVRDSFVKHAYFSTNPKLYKIPRLRELKVGGVTSAWPMYDSFGTIIQWAMYTPGIKKQPGTFALFPDNNGAPSATAGKSLQLNSKVINKAQGEACFSGAPLETDGAAPLPVHPALISLSLNGYGVRAFISKGALPSATSRIISRDNISCSSSISGQPMTENFLSSLRDPGIPKSLLYRQPSGKGYVMNTYNKHKEDDSLYLMANTNQVKGGGIVRAVVSLHDAANVQVQVQGYTDYCDANAWTKRVAGGSNSSSNLRGATGVNWAFVEVQKAGGPAGGTPFDMNSGIRLPHVAGWVPVKALTKSIPGSVAACT